MQSGLTPSVSDVAQAAEVSRATAYRYFPSQAALVQAVVDEALGPILQWQSSLDDAEARITDLLDLSLPRINEFEATFRAALKLSLEQGARRQAGTFGDEVPFSRGHRVALLASAISPLNDILAPDEFDGLVQSLSLVLGIEAFVVLKDICNLDTSRTYETARKSAQAMIRQAVANSSTKL